MLLYIIAVHFLLAKHSTPESASFFISLISNETGRYEIKHDDQVCSTCYQHDVCYFSRVCIHHQRAM